AGSAREHHRLNIRLLTAEEVPMATRILTVQQFRLEVAFSPLRCPLGLVEILLPVLFKGAFGFGCGPARVFEHADRVMPVVRLSWYQPPTRIRRLQRHEHPENDDADCCHQNDIAVSFHYQCLLYIEALIAMPSFFWTLRVRTKICSFTPKISSLKP